MDRLQTSNNSWWHKVIFDRIYIWHTDLNVRLRYSVRFGTRLAAIVLKGHTMKCNWFAMGLHRFQYVNALMLVMLHCTGMQDLDACLYWGYPPPPFLYLQYIILFLICDMASPCLLLTEMWVSPFFSVWYRLSFWYNDLYGLFCTCLFKLVYKFNKEIDQKECDLITIMPTDTLPWRKGRHEKGWGPMPGFCLISSLQTKCRHLSCL